MTKRFINDQSLEHLAPNGTLFLADRCDLEGGIRFRLPTYLLSEEQRLNDFIDFAAWHRSCIFDQLNGFAGYGGLKILALPHPDPFAKVTVDEAADACSA